MNNREAQQQKDDMLEMYEVRKKKLLELLRDGIVSAEEYDKHLQFLDQCKDDPKRKFELALYIFEINKLEAQRKEARDMVAKPMTEQAYQEYSSQLPKSSEEKSLPHSKSKKTNKGAGTWIDRSNPNN